MNPFAPHHVGGPEITGWVRTRGDQLMGASPGAVQAAMHAVMGTPAFAALARGISHSGQQFAPGGPQGAGSPAPLGGWGYAGPGFGPGGGGGGGYTALSSAPPPANPVNVGLPMGPMPGGGCGPSVPMGGCSPYVPAPVPQAPPNVFAAAPCGGPSIASPVSPQQLIAAPGCGPQQALTAQMLGSGGYGGYGPGGGWLPLAQALATTGPAPAAPPYAGGPGVAYGSPVQVVERPLTDIREFPLGFGPTSFPAGTEASVISRPQVVFRGERLVVPSTVAPFFSIIDIKVGNRSQLVNSVALPAQMFIETAVGIRLSFDTAAVAQDVALIVANGTATATTFQAAIVGTAAQ